MTQEELDNLMDSDLDADVTVLEDEEILEDDKLDLKEEEPLDTPPPPTEEHKVVSQLDDVTRDSEIKASEIFDKLEEISTHVGDVEEFASGLTDIIENNISLFEKLCEKFPNVESFKSALEENRTALLKAKDVTQKSQNSSDEIMMIMDIMQYQDIHRQKIERVISVMRALSKYMNSLFASDVDDKSRSTVANHIDGDSSDTVSEDDIEALLESFGKK
jgi:chemotaxis regulatin CheY-phosphate phosphatase CheZ